MTSMHIPGVITVLDGNGEAIAAAHATVEQSAEPVSSGDVRLAVGGFGRGNHGRVLLTCKEWDRWLVGVRCRPFTMLRSNTLVEAVSARLVLGDGREFTFWAKGHSGL